MSTISRRSFLRWAGIVTASIPLLASQLFSASAKEDKTSPRVRVRPLNSPACTLGQLGFADRARFPSAADAMRASAGRAAKLEIYQ